MLPFLLGVFADHPRKNTMATDFRDYFNNRITQEIEKNAQLGISSRYDRLQQASQEKAAQLAELREQRLKLRQIQEATFGAKLGLDPDGVANEAVNLVDSVWQGTKNTARALGAAGNTLIGDLSGVDEYAAAQKADADGGPTAKIELLAEIERRKQADANPGVVSAVQNVTGAMVDSPSGSAQFIAEQLPNSVVSLGAGVAGAKAGAAGGAALGSVVPVVGTAAGAAVGGTLGFLGGMFLGNSLLETGGKAMEKAQDGGMTKEKRVEALKEGAIKGGVITAVDAATLGLGGKVAKGLNKAAIDAGARAEARVLANAGIDITDLKAIESALADPLLRSAARTAGLSAAQQTSKIGTRSATAATGLTMETVGEGAGEYLGELAATGKADIYDAVLEAAAGFSQSVPETAFNIQSAQGNDLNAKGMSSADLSIPDPVQPKKVADATRLEAVKAAIESGDVSALVDPKSAVYAPDQAIAALFGNSQKQGVTPEIKQANFEQASKIVSELEAERAKAQEAYNEVSPEGIAQYQSQLAQAKAEGNPEKAALLEQIVADAANNPKDAERLQKQIARIDQQLGRAQEVLTTFAQANQPKDLDVEAEVAKITSADPVASQDAANRIINLSMAIPESLSTGVASSLASDLSNGLSESQRSYLRTFSKARAAESKLKDLGLVSQEIYRGSPKGAPGIKYVGLTNYRANVTTALTAGNQSAADKQLGMLTRFEASHQGKAQAASEALAAFENDGINRRIVRNNYGSWTVEQGLWPSEKQRALNGGLNINANAEKLVSETKTEAAAISATAAELKAAYAVKFGSGNAGGASNVQNVPQALEGIQRAETELRSEAPTQDGTAEGVATTGGGAAADVSADATAGTDAVATYDSMQPGQQVTLYRGEGVGVGGNGNDANGQWWTTDRAKAERYGTVTEVTLPAEIIAQNAARGDKSNNEFVFPNKRPAELAAAATEEAPSSAASTVGTAQLQSTEETTTSSEGVVPGSEAVAEAVEPQGLTALQQKSLEGTAHGDKKLGDFFTQSAGKETDGSKRPLVAVKNFMSAVALETVKISQYLKDQNLGDGPKLLVWTKFVEKAAAWAPIITRNLKPTHNEKFNYEDPMRFLIQSLTVNGRTVADVEENVKTAISAAVFGYTADQAGRAELNDDKAINKILNRAPDSPVSSDATAMLADVGVYQSQVIDSLGSAVIDALGLRLDRNAPKDMLAKMQVSLGAHALKLMEDAELLVRSERTNDEINKLRSEKLFEDSESGNQTNETAFSTDNTKGHIFYKLTRDSSGQPVGKAKEIADAIKGSQSLIQNLFGIESSLSFPSLTPPKGLQKESDTGMGLPGFIKKVFKLNQTRPWKANKDPLKVLSFFSEEEGLTMAGVEDSSEHTHRRNLNSKRAKNDGLIREFRNFMEFVGELATGEKGMDQEFFLSQEMWKQQRSGYKSNTVNPNTSKIVRWLVAPDAWSTDIDLNNKAQLQSFMLRASEGFGIKPEKADSQKAVDDLTAMMQTPAMQAAVKALQAVLFSDNAQPTEQQRTDIMQAVAAGKQKLHTLASLIAYARYQQAVDTKADSFTTNLMGEVDGVSNGSILNSIMYGAAATAEQLNMLLEKGGIYTLGSKFRQYNLWRGTPGHQDIYESNAQDLHTYVNSMPKGTQPVTAAIWNTAGSPIDAAMEATKDGRDLLKGPINPLNYGGGFKSIIGKMAYNYVDTIYEKLEGFSRKGADQATVNEFVRNVNVLLAAVRAPQMPTGRPIAFYLGYTLSKAQEAALRKAYSDTIGVAAKEVVGANFKPFLDRSKLVTQTVNLTYGLYESVYNASREAMIKEMGIPMLKGEPIHDLTVAQEAELAERLKAILPVMHTAMSKDEGNVDNGILLAKKGRKQNNSAPYKVAVGFGSKLGNGASQLTASGRSMVQTDPGVIAISGTTHALDSAVSHEAQEANHVLNNHDAVGAGINVLAESAELLNKSTWSKTLNYSPLNEAHDALMRVVQGIVAMDQRGELTPEIKAAIKEKLKELSKKSRGSKVESIVDTTAFNIFSEALEANRIKFGAMAQWAVVDQYPMDGGSYQVTDADRQEAQAKLDALSPVRSEADRQALDAFAASLFGSGAVSAAPVAPAPAAAAPKATVTSLFGSIGTPAIASDTDLVEFFESNPEASAAEVIKLLGAEGRMNAINRKILGLVARVVSPDLKIKFVTPQTAPSMVLEKPTTNARGWFVIKDGQEEIYVLSPEFVNSGLTTETLLHELVHAAVARVIDKPSKEAEALVAELEALRVKAQEFATANGLTQYGPALANVQEFVAWGMSNLGLQRDVLTKITMPSKTGSNRLVNGMQKFISALTGLLFKKPDANIDNGLAVLVSNVSGLFFEASQVNARTGTNLNLAQETVAPIDAYTTLDIHQALDNGTLEPSFKAHLANLLGGIVQSLHGPFGAFAASMRKTEAGNPLAVWLKAMETGQAPFASRIVASGFAGSAQEDFAMQQVEATVKAALDGNEALTKIAYKQLSDLYTEVKGKLKPFDFKSQADYDFVFKLESDNGDRSDYLARFAALGLANQQFNSMLKMATERDTRRFGEGQTFTERLENIFEKIVAFFTEKVTKTFAGQNADAKLEALVGQLVDIEAKKRHLIKRNATRINYLAPVEDGARKATEAVRSVVGRAADSDFVRNNRLATVRAVGSLVRTVADDRVDGFLDTLQRYRDSTYEGRQGITAGLISDLKGPLNHFAALLRETKRHEGERKAIITQHSQLALSTFINAGKDLSKEAKASISSVFLRTGAHNLLDTMTLAEIEKLIGDPAELNKAIASVESQLTGKLKDRYIEQANALGYYKATGKSRNPVLMLNSYLIARMAGTQFKKQVTEQQAKQAEPIIASLVSLYALKYSSVQDLAQAKQVFRTENNRPAGNGVEFVLKLHKQMEAESLARLFKGNPALMIHGYTPEILNPHTTIAIADAAEGANLEAQGYSKGGLVTQDMADPDKSSKRIYVLRDGGLAPYLTGVFSLTGLQAKGTKKQSGYVNVNTQAGLDNANLQAEITNAKLQTLQGKNDPRRDLSQQSGNHLVPVFNEVGDIVNWRYMMAESTKNDLLERDNRFENILGALAGSVYDKETTQQQNLKAVEVLLQQFNDEFATRSESYIEVGENSSDPEMRAIWNLLPDVTKRDVKKVWGRNGMKVRVDALDLMFGYRKLSAAEFLRNDPATLQGLQKILREWFNTYARSRGMNEQEADNYAKRLGLALTKGERAWQELVREAKDIIVVKTGIVMLGNIWSNISLLAMSGVPLKDMMQHHLVAMKGATAYQRDSDRLAELETVLQVGYSANDEQKIRDEIVRLKDSLARNPVRELIEAGLMPTIVEDVAAEEDIYSYKSALARKTERFTEKLNPNILAAGRFVYMSHDTKMYQSLSRITQLSDFVARYTLYQHLTTRSNNPLSQADAIQEASDAFVNYDIPMHRGIQFTDDMGFTPFTKYFLRIQRVLLKLARENPARVLMALGLNSYMDLGPIVLDSSFTHKIGNNPFRSGAFQFPGALDDLATVSAGMALIK